MTDYLYYKKDYNGKIIADREDFERCEKVACRYMQSVINPDAEYSEDDVRDCICALCEELYKNEDTANIKSETVDGYSVTYSGNSRKELYEVLKLYLPKELLYRGV